MSHLSWNQALQTWDPLLGDDPEGAEEQTFWDDFQRFGPNVGVTV